MKRRTLWVNVAIGAVIVVVLGLIVISLRPGEEPVDQRTVTAVRGDISSTVTASGTVERAGVVELAFTSGGTITSVDVEPGDSVVSGDVLATVDDTSALQQVESAESTLAQAIQSSASTDASVSSASAALSDAKRAARQTNKRNKLAVQQAKQSLRTAERLWADSCLDPKNSACPNPAAQAQLRAAQVNINSAELAVDTTRDTAANNAIGYEIAVNQAQVTLGQRGVQQSAACGDDSSTVACQNAVASTIAAQQALENAQRAKTSGLLADQQAQQSALDGLAKANAAMLQTQGELRKAAADSVRSAQQTLETAERTYRQGVVAGEQSVRSAQSALTSALASRTPLELSDGGQLTAAQAAIAAAEASVAVAEKAVEDTRLVAPLSGLIGQVPYVVGEVATASAATGGITILPDGPLEVVADFAESDASGVTVGAPATVTFDALAGAQAEGTVIAIDPVATTGSTGLVTYRVRIQVPDAPEAVREGMTASVAVLVAEATDVLVVPEGAITGSGDSASVLLQGPEGEATPVRVTLGLQGDNGTEVTAGIDEGDVLVIPSADDLSFPEGGVPGSGRDPDPDGPFGGGGE